ncbi:SMC-Scp complex subunit ScpB [Gorillibacterium massiliense]|uniref:SMC-Scp complex subunit ScpB n=1 Tax=Gorillibacterium massiliense TaxID=1280390 RepID=UPI0004BAE796|nr:SMC-Scp complex subunit ScpB [Gorillibacterium massiliense]
MQSKKLKSVIEGLLFASGDEGIDIRQLADVMELDTKDAAALVEELRNDLKKQERGIQIVELAGTYQMTTVSEHAPYFERLAQAPTRSSLSQAALETLSIVAYRQPITRIEIEEIRGVACDRALHTLAAKELIVEVGRAEAVGRPILYGTTRKFMDYFGLSDLSELPDSSVFGNMDIDSLEEETRMLFDRPDTQQMTFDDVGQENE